MKVVIRLFATLRQEAGWSEQSVDVEEGATLADVLAAAERLFPSLRITGRPVYAAVNQQYAQLDRVLAEGDVVALFPPVSGGTEIAQGENTQGGSMANAPKLFEITDQPLS